MRAFVDGHGCVPGEAKADKHSSNQVDVVDWQNGQIVTSFVGGVSWYFYLHMTFFCRARWCKYLIFDDKRILDVMIEMCCSCRSADLDIQRVNFRYDAAVTFRIEGRPQMLILPFIEIIKDSALSDISFAAWRNCFSTLFSKSSVYQLWDLLESSDPIICMLSVVRDAKRALTYDDHSQKRHSEYL